MSPPPRVVAGAEAAPLARLVDDPVADHHPAAPADDIPGPQVGDDVGRLTLGAARGVGDGRRLEEERLAKEEAATDARLQEQKNLAERKVEVLFLLFLLLLA